MAYEKIRTLFLFVLLSAIHGASAIRPMRLIKIHLKHDRQVVKNVRLRFQLFCTDKNDKKVSSEKYDLASDEKGDILVPLTADEVQCGIEFLDEARIGNMSPVHLALSFPLAKQKSVTNLVVSMKRSVSVTINGNELRWETNGHFAKIFLEFVSAFEKINASELREKVVKKATFEKLNGSLKLADLGVPRGNVTAKLFDSRQERINFTKIDNDACISALRIIRVNLQGFDDTTKGSEILFETIPGTYAIVFFANNDLSCW